MCQFEVVLSTRLYTDYIHRMLLSGPFTLCVVDTGMSVARTVAFNGTVMRQAFNLH